MIHLHFESMRQHIKAREITSTDKQVFIQQVCENSQELQLLSKSVLDLLENVPLSANTAAQLASDDIQRIVEYDTRETTLLLQKLDKQVVQQLEEVRDGLKARFDVDLFNKHWMLQF